jgi:glycosyltransferase involved in cell wall biosynthesis
MDTTNILTILATRGLGLPVVVSERIHPAHHDIGIVRSLARRCAYPCADAIVVPSAGIGTWIESVVRNESVRVIPNPLRPGITDIATCDPDVHKQKTVIAVGRLDPQKQFDYLLRAFARCSRRHPDWLLMVIGEGAERGNLEALSATLNVSHRVQWMGSVSAPEALLRHADLFVLSSRYEGFPNALLEAMGCGLPVVSFDCPSGPREMICDGIDGVLVPAQDLDALTTAMDRLMSDDAERLRLGHSARESSRRFSLDNVGGMWLELLSTVVRRETHA